MLGYENKLAYKTSWLLSEEYELFQYLGFISQMSTKLTL